MIVPFIENPTNKDLNEINKMELQNLLTNDKPLVNSNLELKLDNELINNNDEVIGDEDEVVNNLSKTINNIIINDIPLDLSLENKNYIENKKEIPVSDVIDNITDTLDIDKNNLESVIKRKKKIKIKNQPKLINKLLNNNVRINKLNKHFKNNKDLYQKIKKLKNELSILQLNTIIDKDEKTGILNDVIKTIDNKVENINYILESNINQNGGNNTYYYKYLKYKIKYLELLSSY